MSNSNLRDRLLELEPYPDDLRESMREVMNKKERPLKKWERPFIVLCCVALGIMLVGAVFLAVTDRTFIGKAPTYLQLALGIAVVLLCLLLATMLRSLKRGTWRFRDDQFVAYAGAGLVFYMYLGSMLFSNRAPNGWDIGAYILFGVLLLLVRIEASEIRLREHMLRNELALAKLAELVGERIGADYKDK